MLTDEYQRFLNLKKNHNIVYVFLKGLKYLFKHNLRTILTKIYNLLFFIFVDNFLKIDLDKKDKLINFNLDDLFKKYNTDKASQFIKNKKLIKGHDFAKFYENHLIEFKNSNVNILELGVLKGDSTASFYNFFKKCHLYAFDLNYRYFNYRSKNIFFHEINLRDKKSISDFVNKHRFFFDIIIDDASHLKSCILENLNNFTPSLKKDSLYVIEDYMYPELYTSKNDIKSEPHISALLDSIHNSKKYNSDIISDNIKKNILNRKKSVFTYQGQNNNSQIAFLRFN